MISKPASRIGLFRPTSSVAAPMAGSFLVFVTQMLSRGIRVKDSCEEGREGEREKERGGGGGREGEKERGGERGRERISGFVCKMLCNNMLQVPNYFDKHNAPIDYKAS